MTWLVWVVSLGLIVVAAGWVLWPLRKGWTDEPRLLGAGSGPAGLTARLAPKKRQEAELLARRDALYTALQDADHDMETGKLSAEDYGALRRQYVAEAARVLAQIDSLVAGEPESGSVEIDDEIEAAVVTMRRERAAAGGDA